MPASKQELSATALADAATIGDKAACEKHGITLRTLQRYRKAQGTTKVPAEPARQATAGDAATSHAAVADDKRDSPSDKRPKRSGPGRPTKLSPELQERIIEQIERGIEPDTAAQAEGIDRATFYRWIQRGKLEEGTQLAEFASEVARASAVSEVNLVDRWLGGDGQGIGFGQAKAAAEFLRLTRRRYGEKVRIQVADELEELLSIVERICRPEDFARVLEAVAARDRGEETASSSGEADQPVH